MPCKSCNSIKVLIDNEAVCPKCNNLNIVDKDLAEKIFYNFLIYLDKLFDKSLSEFSKHRLLIHVIWEREKFARSYFENYQLFHLDKFLTFNILIHRLMEKKKYFGNLLADKKNTEKLVDIYTRYVRFFSWHIFLKDGFYSMICKKHFDYEKVSYKDLSDFRIVPNENYIPIKYTFESNDILSEEQGLKKIKQYEEKYSFEKMPRDKVTYTKEQFIEKLYPMLIQLYSGLLRNRLFEIIFDFKHLKEFNISPNEIMDLVNQHPLVKDRLTECNIEDFKIQLKKFFPNIENNMLQKIFIFNEKNSNIFPLFPQLEDHIFISHRTSFLIYTLLHPILFKDLFDKETEKRSLEFEKEDVKNEFKKIGFNYLPNLKDKKKNPTIEIDGIATLQDKMLIIECKVWGLKPFFEHGKVQQYLERDLKGIIDGIKYTTKENGTVIKKKQISLLEKIEFVKKNMELWGFKKEVFSEIDGLVVIRAFPPINEYRSIKIISINEISKLF